LPSPFTHLVNLTVEFLLPAVFVRHTNRKNNHYDGVSEQHVECEALMILVFRPKNPREPQNGTDGDKPKKDERGGEYLAVEKK